MHENYSNQLDKDTGQFNKEKKYWLTQLSGEPEPSGFQMDFAADPGKRIPAEFSWELPDEIVSKLLKLSNNFELRLYIALTAGIVALIHKYTGKEDIMIGAPIFRQTIEGQLINTVLTLRNSLAGDINFRQLLMRVSKTLYDANENQNYPFETLLYKLNIPYSKEADFPLFDAAILLENLHEREYLDRIHLKIIFSFHWEKQENHIRGKLEYNAELYREANIERIIKHFIVLLEAVFRDMDLSLRRIDIVTEEEKEQLLYKFNNPLIDYPADKTLHYLFVEQAAQTPDYTAVFGRGLTTATGTNTDNNVGAGSQTRPITQICPITLSYNELNEQSARLAQVLIEKGILPDRIVAIMMERSVEMIIGIFGVLKAGGAYLPIDPGYPGERIEYMLKDSGATILLTAYEEKIIVNCQLLIVNCKLKSMGPMQVHFHHSSFIAHHSNLAYIIYTSGTTGGPKGVMVEHRNALNTVTWYAKQYGVSGGIRVLQISDYTFDPSVEQIFGTLLHGASLYIVTKETRGDLHLLRRFIDEHQVQIINFVPMLLKELLAAGPVLKSLRVVMSGGDKLEKSVKDRILEKGYKLYNHYGPTEITVDALTAKCGPGPVVLGKPIANVNCYILGMDQEFMPVGIAGELYIGGGGVTPGYLNNPELTAQRFGPLMMLIKNKSFYSGAVPAGAVFSKKAPLVYKTGDRARWLEDGNIEFLGRIDDQVKIRGFRVELGEIENHLRQHPRVKDALVTVIESPGESGNKNLCAYFTVETGGNNLDIQDLKEYLAALLPGYMIPLYFCQLDALPLTAGGKINRKALPLPREQEVGSMYIPPRDDLEKTLVALWAEVLEIDPAIIGIDTDFFECGGHSLNAAVLAARIHKELNVKVPMMVLFEKPFIRGLGRYIQGAVKEKHMGVGLVEEKEYYPLSSAQKRLYILQQVEPGSAAYNLPVLLDLEGYLNKQKLEGVFDQLIRRHESFRTCFEIVNEEPVQRIHKNIKFKIEYHDSLHLNGSFNRPFDLSKAPLLRVGLLKKNEFRHILMVDSHHIIADGLSMNILVKDFTALYQEEDLLELRVQYKDFSNWQNKEKQEESIKRQENFWLNEFAGEIPILELPSDYVRPAVQTFAGSSIYFEIDKATTGLLNKLAFETDATIYMVLLAIYTVFLSKVTNQEEIVVGSPIAGRRNADLEKIIGMFVNTLAFRNFPSGEKKFIDFLEELKNKTLKVYDHQDYQYEDLVEQVVINRDVSRNPLFDAMFALQNMKIASVHIPGLKLSPYPYENKTSKFDLTLMGVEKEGKLFFTFEYSTKLFREETIQKFIGYFKNIVNGIIKNKDERISDYETITETEKNQILFEFNNTAAEFPKDKTIHQLFVEQVGKTPDHIALVGATAVETLRATSLQTTYRQLNDQSGHLAGLLIEKGVLPDDIIGIMMERSVEMIIGIFGILKAGGAYLPIDPGYPRERIQYMLNDSNVKILLGMEGCRAEIIVNCQLLIVNCKLKNLPKAPSHHSSIIIHHSNHLSYIIYTSGTTGKPKGVAIEHHSLANRLNWMQKKYPLNANDTILQKTTFTFDVSVWEIFWWSLVGARLCLLLPGGEKDPGQIAQTIERNHISTLHFVPSMLRVFLDYLKGNGQEKKISGLRQVIVSGEALLSVHVKRFYELENKVKGAVLANLYGPTEAAIDVSYFDCQEVREHEIIPIGKPIDNIRLFILDKHLHNQPVGIPGELYISGVGLARGYLNRPELTSEKFVNLHHSSFIIHHSILYRTGDLARWMPDGNIEFLGRIDQQVKIRGFRIELGEIEDRLLKHNNVKDTVVIDRIDNTGEKYLCAYIVFRGPTGTDHTELKSYLSQTLPEYMIPAHFVKIENIPLTLNGKIDRKALPEPGAKQGDEYVAPATDREREITEIWKQLLGLEKVSIHKNFFDAGGNSLKIIKLAIEFKKRLGIEIPTAKVFQYTTIASQAKYIVRVNEKEELRAIEEFETEKVKNRLKQKREKSRL